MRQQKLTGLCLGLIYIMDGTILLVCIIEIHSAPAVHNTILKYFVYLLINSHFMCNSTGKGKVFPSFLYSVYALYIRKLNCELCKPCLLLSASASKP